MAHDRQHNTPPTRTARWSVFSRKKFASVVGKIRGFDDSLQSLFPGEDRTASNATRKDYDKTTATQQGLLDEVSKKMDDPGKIIGERSTGALTLSVNSPIKHSEYVSARAYWGQDQRDGSWSHGWDGEANGFISLRHEVFLLYWRKGFTNKQQMHGYDVDNDEDRILLDPESHMKYENINPGTVTVEGFGIECWDFEMAKPRDKTTTITTSRLPDLPARKLLRRVHELQNKPNKLGFNPERDEMDLKEFVGDLYIVYYDQAGARGPKCWIRNLYAVLNRTDLFAHFISGISIGAEWVRGREHNSIGLWNFLCQIIVAKELARRLATKNDDYWPPGFTAHVLGSLIVSDLWLSNVSIILTDTKIPTAAVKRPENDQEKAKAEEYRGKGDIALKEKRYQDAIDCYTEAIRIDSGNAAYRYNRSVAFFEEHMFKEAADDAFFATRLDMKHAKAWSQLGTVQLRNGHIKRAEESFKMAVAMAGEDATAVMRNGLRDAEDRIEQSIQATNTEQDTAKWFNMCSEFDDQDWDITYKGAEFHSHVHKQQVEGLLLFAERVKWPYINEVRDFAEGVYTSLRAGELINLHLHDWIFGLSLPGKWFAFKIMSALILCTPSIREIGEALYPECGLSLPSRSYWRIRTVLGRVLGCWPRVISLCGWIGPCPAVEFEDAEPGEKELKNTKHIRIQSRRIAPLGHNDDLDGDVTYIGPRHNVSNAMRIQPNEELEPYVADLSDSQRWILPEPPVREFSVCELRSIRLKKLPLERGVAQELANGELSEVDLESETQYRASLVFKTDVSPSLITYKLFTNPVFVTLPPCRPGPRGLQHEVHMRELARFQGEIWSIQRLKDHTVDDYSEDDDTPMVINATGKGAELLARAWCSERGRNAVIRRPGGPCFVCAVRAAGKSSLRTGVLIWLD